MRQVHFLTHLGFMFLGDEWRIVQRIDWSIKIRLRVLQLPKDGATVNAMKQNVVVVRLVREPSVVQEHILQTLAAFLLMCYSDSLSLHNWCNAARVNAGRWSPAMQGAMRLGEYEERAS